MKLINAFIHDIAQIVLIVTGLLLFWKVDHFLTLLLLFTYTAMSIAKYLITREEIKEIEAQLANYEKTLIEKNNVVPFKNLDETKKH